METFYHGTSVLFKEFDIAHALEGDGKAKFGFGTYVTEVYKSAAHYAYNKKRPERKDYYVYTLEIPDLTEDNHLFSTRAVHPSIIERTEKALGEPIPTEAREVGKFFRKYVGNRLIGMEATVKKLIGSASIEAEKAASKFFAEIGLEYYVWPQAQTNPNGATNRVVLNINKICIIRIDKVELAPKEGKIGVRQLIETYYPQYGGWFTYDPSLCAAIRKTTDEWGILHNMASCSIVVHGVQFKSSETLFQIMRFQDENVVKEVYRRNNKKWAQHYVKDGYCRPDWGTLFLDALKFAMQMKYEQCEEFRNELERSKGLYIVEDETKRKSTSYGVQLKESGLYEGSNLLGRLLMELRDNGRLEYSLPTDAMNFLEQLK